jgi:acetate kinase
MQILVFNGGSSSLSFTVFATAGQDQATPVLTGKAHRVGVTGQEASFLEYRCDGQAHRHEVAMASHGQAAIEALRRIVEQGVQVDWIGHRFVHGGTLFPAATRVDDATMRRLQACVALAPLHNPIALEVIREARRAYPGVPQYVTFDSAFHSSLPPAAYTYALPPRLAQRFGFRRYGFHGLSYAYVSGAAARHLAVSPEQLNLVACHLGTGGSSVAAIAAGRSVDTSMGYSPLPGLVMSTRSGDLDPMLALYLMAAHGYHPDAVTDLLNRESGLLGLSAFSSDLRDITARVAAGDPEACLAFDMYVHRLRGYVGAYAVVLGRVDALVFTDDIGVRHPLVRQRVAAGLSWCGIRIDPARNQAVTGTGIEDIGAVGAPVRVLVVPTQEELVICLDGLRLLGAATG